MNSIPKVSEETLKIEALLTNVEKGTFFSYGDLQQLTGVIMNNRGKGFMRTALKRLKQPYECVRGSGIKILSAENATRIVVNRVVRIDNSVKRADKITKQVHDRVYDELTEPEQKNIKFLSIMFGTIRNYSQSAKRIFRSQPLTIGNRI